MIRNGSRVCILLVFLLPLACGADPRGSAATRVPTARVFEDIDHYLALLVGAHSDPHRSITKAALQDRARSIKAEIERADAGSIRLVEAFFHLQRIAAAGVLPWS